MLISRLLLCCTLGLGVRAVSLAKHLTGGDDKSNSYYWPHARGHPRFYSKTSVVGPKNLNTTLAWSWHHPEGQYHTIVVSAPLLDNEKNVYISSYDAVRKFSPDGELMWTYQTPGPGSQSVSLMGGAVFGSTQTGFVFGLDMETGRPKWIEQKSLLIPGDTGYVESLDGLVFAGVDSGPGGGATRLLGLDAEDGKTLWEYRLNDGVLWNIMPVFPGDGSLIVMNTNGDLYRLGMYDGALLWKADVPQQCKTSFSDGGVMLGADGTSYTCTNYDNSGQLGDSGVLRAFRLKDGHMLWERILQYPCNSWPAVTPDDHSVIVPTGAFVKSPSTNDVALRAIFQKSEEEMQTFSLSLGSQERHTYGLGDLTAAIQAFDTRTGALQWSTELPPYGRMAAVGDEEGVLVRQRLGMRDQCLPAQFGSPTISGDGTIYVGRADGLLYAVENGTNRFHTFDAKAGFLHPGTSWAPGLMAVTSCDGLFVWKF